MTCEQSTSTINAIRSESPANSKSLLPFSSPVSVQHDLRSGKKLYIQSDMSEFGKPQLDPVLYRYVIEAGNRQWPGEGVVIKYVLTEVIFKVPRTTADANEYLQNTLRVGGQTFSQYISCSLGQHVTGYRWLSIWLILQEIIELYVLKQLSSAIRNTAEKQFYKTCGIFALRDHLFNVLKIPIMYCQQRNLNQWL